MVEIIGFVISLLALLYLFMKQNPAPSRRTPAPRDQEEEAVEDEDDPFREFLKEKEATEREAKTEEPLPPPSPPKIAKKPKKPSPPSLEEYRLASQIEERRLKSALADRQLKSRFHHSEERNRNLRPSQAHLAVQHLTSRRDLIIYQEIMNKPKSLRSEIL
jgi:type IV secretory pathway VirB10-like protein